MHNISGTNLLILSIDISGTICYNKSSKSDRQRKTHPESRRKPKRLLQDRKRGDSMNQTTKALYLAMLDAGKLEDKEQEAAFYRAYDYIIDTAECDDNENEKSRIFNLLSDLENQARQAAFSLGIRAAFDLLQR